MNKRFVSNLVLIVFLCTNWVGCSLYKAYDSRSNTLPRTTPTSTPLPTPIETSFCDIVSNPDKYNGSLIQTRTTLAASFENAFAYDLNCYDKKNLVWYETDNEKAEASLRNFLEIKIHETKRADVTFVGIFQHDADGFGHLNGFRFRFIINDVKEINIIPQDVPWPWEKENSKFPIKMK